MKVLVIADNEINSWWDGSLQSRLREPEHQALQQELQTQPEHSDVPAGPFDGVELILSAGDLAPSYLEYLVTLTNLPLLYVRGNHDSIYDVDPPQGCICIEDNIAEIYYDADSGRLRAIRLGRTRKASNFEKDMLTQLMPAWKGELPGHQYYYSPGYDSSGRGGIVWGRISTRERLSARTGILRIAGLGGSMRYRKGRDMYTEAEMSGRVRQLERKLRLVSAHGHLIDAAARRISKNRKERESALAAGAAEIAGSAGESRPARRPLDILLTHAPCRRYGDMEDLPHRGFESFNMLLEKWQPAYHFYGHVHKEYGRFERELAHPSGTRLINACGYCIAEL